MEKVYRGRNPSPPEEFYDFDFLSSSANRNIVFLKPTHIGGHIDVVPENIIKEALLKYKLVSKKLKDIAEAKVSLQEESGSYSGDNTDNKCINYGNPEENVSDNTLSKKLKPIETYEITDSQERDSITQECMSLSLGEVSEEDVFATALSKDVALKNKLHDWKEDLLRCEYSKSSSKVHEDDYFSDDQPRNKSCERKQDLPEYRKSSSLRKKRDELIFEDNEYRRSKSKSSRSRRDDYSSDDSVYSRRHGHYRSKKRSESNESMSRKKSDRKSSRRHSDYCSDSNDDVRIISISRKETVAKNRKGLPSEDSDRESLNNKKVKSDPKEKKTDHSKNKKGEDSVKESLNDEVRSDPKEKKSPDDHHKPSSHPTDDHYEDIELTTEVFGGSESFYCKVCQLNLNGVSCYETHMNGKKHRKALNAQLLRPEALLYQVIGDRRKDPLFMQALNSNVKMVKVDCKRASLQSTVDSYHDNPLPGLNYIDEIHAQDGTKNYYCELCEAPCLPSSIFPHLLGFKHYMNFLKIIQPSYYERNKDRPKKDIERRVKHLLKEHERMYGKKEITVMKCEVGFPCDDPVPSWSSHREVDFGPNPIVTDDYGDFYCKICDAHMNNKNMYHAHMVGKRHLKNEKKYASGFGTGVSSSGKTKAPPNTPSVLEGMLAGIKDTPIVGLNFLRETQVSTGEYYTCFICGCSATSDIIDHIVTMKHRIKYLEQVNTNGSIPNSISSIRELEVNTQTRESLVQDLCAEVEGRYGRGKVEVYI